MSETVSILGMACRFPGADSIEEFWENLINGRDSISRFPEAFEHRSSASRAAGNRICARGLLGNVDCFDHEFFGMNRRDAMLTDPQERMLLECAYNALEDASIPLDLAGKRIGAYVSASRSTYAEHLAKGTSLTDEEREMAEFLGSTETLAARLAYRLNLTGPALVLQSACSSALVATHVAMGALLRNEIDYALVAAASLVYPENQGYTHHEGGVHSRDGTLRAYDAGASGYVRGHGVGAVVLGLVKPDGPAAPWAYIRGSAVNNDGAARVGFSAPSIAGQRAVLDAALRSSGAAPQEVVYVEGHGSGTELGDSIELKAIADAYRTKDLPRDGGLYLGSVKSNIGHLDSAAGMAGLIKGALICYHRRIPPAAHFEQPSKYISFEANRLIVSKQAVDLGQRPGAIHVGVTSVGLGGTNAHLILAAAPRAATRQSPVTQPRLFLVSGKTQADLATVQAMLRSDLSRDPNLNLDDLAATLGHGRTFHTFRRSFVAGSRDSLIEQLGRSVRSATGLDKARREASWTLVASGFGDELPDIFTLRAMLPGFDEVFEECEGAFHGELGRDLKQYYEACRRAATQPASPGETYIDGEQHLCHFVANYVLGCIWLRAGVSVSAVCGLSVGEYAAAALAGILSVKDVIRMLTGRSGVLRGLPAGAMVAVLEPNWMGAELLSDMETSIDFGHGFRVFSGEPAAVAAIKEAADRLGRAALVLPAARAYHSSRLNAAEAEYEAILAGIQPGKARIPFIKSDGGIIKPGESIPCSYWARHLSGRIEMGAVLQSALKVSGGHMLQLSASAAIAQATRPFGNEMRLHAYVESAHNRAPMGEVMLRAAGAIWERGGFRQRAMLAPFTGYSPSAVRTSPYPFRRTWIAPEAPAASVGGNLPVAGVAAEQASAATSVVPPPDVALVTLDEPELRARARKIWANTLGVDHVDAESDFFELGGNSLIAIQMIGRLKRELGVSVSYARLRGRPKFEHFMTALIAARAQGDDGIAPKGGEISATFLVERLRTELASIYADLGMANGDSDYIGDSVMDVAVPQIVALMQAEFRLVLHPNEVADHRSIPELAAHIANSQGAAQVAGGAAEQAYYIELSARLEKYRQENQRLITMHSRGNDPGETVDEPVVFLLSSARAGSTLLRVLLAGNERLVCPPELHLLMYDTLQERAKKLPSKHFASGLATLTEFLAAANPTAASTLHFDESLSIAEVYRRLIRAGGSRLLIDKSPSYASKIDTLLKARDRFPQARYIFLHRDPRAVIESYTRNRFDSLAGITEGTSLRRAEFHWSTHNLNIDMFRECLPGDQVREVAYRDIAGSPERTLRELCDWLGVPFTERMLQPYRGERMRNGPGDPNFLSHSEIESESPERWQDVFGILAPTDATIGLAAKLGYDLKLQTAATHHV